MGRRNKSRGNSDRRVSRDKYEQPQRAPHAESFGQREQGPGGLDYHVRTIAGSRATKVYRCPGCDQTIVVGVAHVVVWPEDAFGGGEDRRHWHSGCWRGRGTRSITRRWS